MTTRLLTPFLVVISAILFGLYQIRLKSLLEVGGVWKEVQDIGGELKETCTYVDELKGCEQISLHEPSGVIFLACAPPIIRSQWLPPMGAQNISGAGACYIATYDPSSNKVTKLIANGFNSPRGLSTFGMDIVPSTNNPDELTIYVTNIRPPHVDLDLELPPGVREAKRDEIASARAKEEGPDPSIEVFRHVLGSDSMQHVATWADEKIMTSPNDVVGLPDGKGVWFTNPLPHKVGISNELSIVLQQKLAWIGFCGADGCKLAATGLYAPNGIARSPFQSNDTFYVAHTFLGGMSLFTRQSDNRLLLDEQIPTESGLDNLSVDSKGAVWAAGLPKLLTSRAHFLYPTQVTSAPSNVFKITLNVGESSFYGEKYSVQKVLEDDGTKVSGVTAVVHDATRGRLFMHGLAGDSLIVCQTK